MAKKTKHDLQKALDNFIGQFNNPLVGAEEAKKRMYPFGSFSVNRVAPVHYASLIQQLQ